MKKNLLTIAIFILSAAFQGASALDVNNPLPNWIDSSREKADGRPPVRFAKANPPADFRIPAEYEPVSAVVMGWAGYTSMLNAIAKAASGPGRAAVWAAEGPSSVSGVPASQYSQINAPIDTVWVRDYGPFGISASQSKVGIVDAVYRHYQYRRNDDALPTNLGKIKKIDVFGLSIILDGGNLMMDSKGNLFMTKRTYIWNSDKSPAQVDAALKAAFKVKNIFAFEYAGYPDEPGDGTGHIDMFMKLLNDHTVLISLADTEPFKSNAEKAVAFFKGKTAPDGQPYKVITVKGWDSGAWYTYTNSLIVNNTVLMPSYSGKTKENAEAKAAYEAGMPGVTVVSIASDESITAGGSIHCVTQTIPAFSGRESSAGETASQAEQPAADLQELETIPLIWTPVPAGNESSPALDQLKDSK